MTRTIAVALGGLVLSTFIGCKSGGDTPPPATSTAMTPASPSTDRVPMPTVSPDVEITAPIMVSPGELAWQPGPDALPSGVQIAVLEGTPPFADEHSFTLALKMPRGYKIPPHTHLVTERVTVLGGSFHIGHGAKLDAGTGRALHQGGLVMLPQNHTHFAFTTSDEAVVMLQGVGPWGIFYVNPKDDPRAQPPEKPRGFVSRFDPPVSPAALEMTEVAFKPAPPGLLPRGAEIAILEGDQTKNQNFLLRVKVPDGYRFPIHSHSVTDRFVVISGAMMVGLGDTWKADAMKELMPGSIAILPAGTNHYLQAKGETVIQVSGTGPFDIKWANPDDDPAKEPGRQATAKP